MSTTQKRSNRLVYKDMKKNMHFRRIPDYIQQELGRIQSRNVTVAAIIETTKAEISKGAIPHIDIRMSDGGIVAPERITPEMMSGLYARRNRNGIIWILQDLPKITKTLWWESPNFGDPSKGYHTNYRDIKVYQRRLEPPRDWEIAVSVVSETETCAKIKAIITSTLDRQDRNFANDLFFALNLMQEQFHDCHVFDAAMTDEDIATVTTVGWEIFPPGTIERPLAAIARRMRNTDPHRFREIQNRAETLSRLHPSEYIVGSGMNSRYFGAKFGESIVVFENADYGNAIYILFDNWQEISKMSRINILKRHEKDFIRIVHKTGWERVLRHYINVLKRENHGD